MEHENKDSKPDIDIVITEPEKEESYDETDAKLFSGKLFGDRHENKPDVVEEKQEEKFFEEKTLIRGISQVFLVLRFYQ